MVACSIVSSRLDYCNSLLVDMSEKNFAKLQVVQNTLARVVTGTKRYDHIKREVIHITPVLANLHWLPIKARVTFKIATLIYNIQQSNSPFYLASLLPEYKPSRELRSSAKEQFKVTASKLKTSSRAFRHSAPNVWNTLPTSIRDCLTIGSFRRNLKTHLYKTAYST